MFGLHGKGLQTSHWPIIDLGLGLFVPSLKVFSKCPGGFLLTEFPHPSSHPIRQALRSFLTEFRDHELVAERTATLDGGEQREVLYSPLEEGVLRKILEQMDQQQNQ